MRAGADPLELGLDTANQLDGCAWGHALNGLGALRLALAKPHLDSLEVDVCWNAALRAAVARHARESHETDPRRECTLEQWVDEVLRARARGRALRVIKLDFKHLGCAEQVLATLEQRMGEAAAAELPANNSGLGGAVALPECWLNADVLPCDSAELALEQDGREHVDVEHDVEAFFAVCNNFCARTAQRWTVRFSLGWQRTDWRPCGRSAYAPPALAAMRALWKARTTHDRVTFALRASMVLRSWDSIIAELVRPLEAAGNRVSLTVWTGWEGVPANELLEMVRLANREGIDMELDIQKGSKLPYWHPVRWGSTLMDYALPQPPA